LNNNMDEIGCKLYDEIGFKLYEIGLKLISLYQYEFR